VVSDDGIVRMSKIIYEIIHYEIVHVSLEKFNFEFFLLEFRNLGPSTFKGEIRTLRYLLLQDIEG
jgi:hypothetical protein